MKTNRCANSLSGHHLNWMPVCFIATMTVLSGAVIVQGQGTIVFSGQVGLYGTNYYEQGMGLHVLIPTPSSYHDGMVIVPPNTYNNVPSNSTPFMAFFQQYSPDDYVAFSLTNGYSFGLTSVDLADPNSPSLSPVPITFLGFKTDGSSVTNIFTTLGNSATSFLNYTFTSAFASGLTSVSILSTRWAMDNLVFGNVQQVPEPGMESLLVLGVLAFAAYSIRGRRGK